MDKQKGTILGIGMSLLFYGLTMGVIFITTLLFDHADAALGIQIALCIIIISFYNIIENRLCSEKITRILSFDISFFITSVLIMILYWYLVHSSLTNEYLRKNTFLSGLEYFLALVVYIITLILLIMIRLLTVMINKFRGNKESI